MAGVTPARAMARWFDDSASRYARDVVPVLAPLAADFVQYAAPDARDRALDVGTGTGLLARLIAPHVATVTGLDVSHRSLRAAQSAPSSGCEGWVQADAEQCPFPGGAFSLMVASLGLNATHPDRVLRAIRRCLARGGRLAIQEWGPADAITRDIDELLADHAVAAPDPQLAALRDEQASLPLLWRDVLQDAEDVTEWLSEAGFTVLDAREGAPVAIQLESPELFLRYLLAWTFRHREVAAMSFDARSAFLSAARARLIRAAQLDGSLVWQPVVIRAHARLCSAHSV